MHVTSQGFLQRCWHVQYNPNKVFEKGGQQLHEGFEKPDLLKNKL